MRKICERCKGEYVVLSNNHQRARFCPDCRKIVGRETAMEYYRQHFVSRKARGAFVLCIKDTDIYPAGHLYHAGLVKADIRAGYVTADAFQWEDK